MRDSSTGADTAPVASSTANVLRELTGVIGVDEVGYGSIQGEAAAADVIVRGPVSDIEDLGSLGDPADNAKTHEFRLTVTVKEAIKGKPERTVPVRIVGLGDADEMRRGLTNQEGLWILSRSTNRTVNDLVPVTTTSVLFEEDGEVVAPLAEGERQARPEVASLADATEKARQGSEQRPTSSPSPLPTAGTKP